MKSAALVGIEDAIVLLTVSDEATGLHRMGSGESQLILLLLSDGALASTQREIVCVATLQVVNAFYELPSFPLSRRGIGWR